MAALILMTDDIARRQLRRERVFRDRANPLDYLQDVEVVERYRLPRPFIYQLMDVIAEDLKRTTQRSHPLPVSTQVLVTLRYLAKASFFSECGDLHGISRASVSRSIDAVTKSICSKIDNINFPTENEAIQIKQDFFKMAGFPNVLGAIDGTLISIIAPKENEPEFRNVVCKWPGSVHDSFMFSNSALKDHMEARDDGWLLGDSAYALKKYMMTPKLNPSTAAEQSFNAAHSRTRVVVERALGVCKSRFRCIHKSGGVLLFTPAKSVQIIMACLKLHNMCVQMRIPAEENEVLIMNQDDAHPQVPNAAVDQTGQAIRQRLIQRFN
ncbi:putative nuclease HARBI1 isoform X2 [Ostrea edulis]|uniref:putative nuclease HARBI1 isoform X2 n=1 Tax=Ostrea edulis TaxID=37623 RepID=UPI0024AFB5A5|nr:putative nuclease HARBI1 isoform X2 [Ostrea edulis]